VLARYLRTLWERDWGFTVGQQINARSNIVCLETLFLKLLQPFNAVVKSLVTNFQLVKAGNQRGSWVGVKETGLTCQ
jgi:hypothetical protein